MTDPIRCIEFFCGIGGLHYALNIARIRAQVVAAYDVNEIANKVYKHNFKKAPLTRTIDRLAPKDIEKFDADCWLVSPPCQPYTRGGNGKDIEDPRARALVHLIELLPKLSKPPKYIFVENVKNFEISESRQKLVDQLDSMNYEINECLLSPEQLGIPNRRLRYYLTARRRSDTSDATDLPPLVPSNERDIHTAWPFGGNSATEVTIPEIGLFLEKISKNDTQYSVPSKYILKLRGLRLDIVRSSDKMTSCVTKAYGSHHILTSGSVITRYDWNDPSSLLDLGLRFLTPTEIARLHAFPLPGYQLHVPKTDEKREPQPFSPSTCPPHLEFPRDVGMSQQFKLLGNSLNCWVVAELLRCVLFEQENLLP
ncbi:S-adenosyl-L-methionine-dependent methyltransferase [Spinellus fusiger]|nr:S-adenosyl-L-methionine-dependent methyltransferase [Spinellus fusiger]